MRSRDLLKIARLAFAGTLVLAGCSFQKNKAEPEPKIIIHQNPKESASALEALQQKDMAAFEQYVSTMNAEQINLYLVDGSTLLEQAVRQGNLLAVEILIEKGALPLKTSKDTKTTPYSLAQKVSEPIEKALLLKINNIKAEIVGLIRAREYQKAFILQNDNYVQINDFLFKGSHFLDLILEQETSLTEDLKPLVHTLLKVQPSLSSSGNKLLKFSKDDTELFKKAVQLFKSQSIEIEKSEIVRLIGSFNLDVHAANVNALNSEGIRSQESLVVLQQAFVQRLLQSRLTNPLQIDRIYASLQALKGQAGDKTFCGICVHQILDSKDLRTHHNDLIKLLIGKSENAPEDFIESLLGALPPADFKSIVSLLSPEMRKNQQSVFESEWTIEEYEVLRSLGMKMSGQQTAQFLWELFKKRHNGDENASKTLVALGKDWELARGLFTEEEQHKLIRNEFIFAFENELKHDDLLSIIQSIRTIEPKGILFGEINGEKVWLNPLAVVKLRTLIPSNITFEIMSTNFKKNIALIFGGLNDEWFMKTEGWKISSHDAVWLNIIQDVTTANKLAPPFKQSLVKSILKLYGPNIPGGHAAIELLLKATDTRFGTGDSTYREKYLPTLLLSDFGLGKYSIVLKIVEQMDENIELKEMSAATEFVAMFYSESDIRNQNILFTDVFLTYLKKQNPRFRLALEGQHDEYVAFLSGELEHDPLCKPESFKTYQHYCQKHKEELEIYNQQHAMEFIGIHRNRGLLARRLALSHFTTHDRKTIDALTELAKIATESATIQNFFAQHSWILNKPFDQLKPIEIAIPKNEQEISNPGLPSRH